MTLTLPSKHFTQLTRLAVSYVNSNYVKGVIAKELRASSSDVTISRKYLSDYELVFSGSRDLAVYTQTFKYSIGKGVGEFTLELFLWVDSDVLGYSSDILGASLSIGGNTRELAYSLKLEDSLTSIMGTLSRFSRYMLGWLGIPSLTYSRDSGSKVHLTYGTVLQPEHTDIKFTSSGSMMPLASHAGSFPRSVLLDSLKSYSDSLVRDGYLLESSIFLGDKSGKSDAEGGISSAEHEGASKPKEDSKPKEVEKPKVKADTVVKPKAKAKAKVDTVVKPKAKAKVDTVVKPKEAVKPKAKVDTVVKPKAKDKVDTVVKPKAKDKVDTVVKPKEAVKPKAKVETVAKPKPKAKVDTVVKPKEVIESSGVSKPKAKRGRPRIKVQPKKDEVVETVKPKAKRGRPKGSTKPKVEDVEVTKPKARRGRPKGSTKAEGVVDTVTPKAKVAVEETPKPKAKRGIPRKKVTVAVEEAPKPKAKRGRPRKEVAVSVEETPKPKAKRGRPRKKDTVAVEEAPKPKAKRGRPKTSVK